VGRRKDHNIAHSTAVQGDGKIILAGNSLVRYKPISAAYSFATVRYSIDGSLDKSCGDSADAQTRRRWQKTAIPARKPGGAR
jgi:hypothetical protein